MTDYTKLEPDLDFETLRRLEDPKYYIQYGGTTGRNASPYNPVSQPEHYNIGSIETIDYIEDVLTHSKAPHRFIDHCHATTLKYLGTRLWHKKKPIEDAKKARQYLDWMIKKMEEELMND